jgi:hypothetical protein
MRPGANAGMKRIKCGWTQGPQSWGKLAIETWRVKTELIIFTNYIYVIIITTSILNLGFKTIAPKTLAHKNCTNKYWKYTQIFATTKTRQNLLQKSSNIGTCLKYLHMHKILALAQNIGGLSKYRRQMYAANVGAKCWRQMYTDFRNICGKCWRPIYAELWNYCAT